METSEWKKGERFFLKKLSLTLELPRHCLLIDRHQEIIQIIWGRYIYIYIYKQTNKEAEKNSWCLSYDFFWRKVGGGEGSRRNVEIKKVMKKWPEVKQIDGSVVSR